MDVNEETLREARASSGTRPGTYACVEVEDSGCGMDEMVLSKLFDPFFTTKFSGRGLGLSAAQGIVTGHHGAILVRSSKGQGSCLTVLLPRSSAVQVSLDTTAAKPTGENLGALVLVVDDEEPVLLVTAEVLKEQCYRVLTSKSGRDALEVYRQHASDVSLVLLDLTMPGMNGEDTLRALQALRPDVKVVLMTGYTEDEVRLRFMHGELAGFLTKPFSTKELVATIEAAIKAPRPRLEARP
jgi:two-component system cell cycle sensor histidine kinase/response regulator CckA